MRTSKSAKSFPLYSLNRRLHTLALYWENKFHVPFAVEKVICALTFFIVQFVKNTFSALNLIVRGLHYSLPARNYLTRRQQEALRDFISFVGKQFVVVALNFATCFTQAQQGNIDAVAQNVLHHNISLTGGRCSEKFCQMVFL